MSQINPRNPNKMEPVKLFLLAVLALQIAACDRASQLTKLPKIHEYDDCVLQYMNSVGSEVAARAIQKSCRAQSGVMAHQDSALPLEAVTNLNGNGSTLGDSFNGRIYNGNDNWIVTQVTVMLTPDKIGNDPETAIDRRYVINISVDPLTIESFSFPMLDQHLAHSWNITSAKGINVPQ